MSYTPRRMEPGLPLVKIWVKFAPPEPCTIELQGAALRAYYRWLEEDDDASVEALDRAIYRQCENHIVEWSQIDDWGVAWGVDPNA